MLGVPWLFALAYSGVGFSVYFALGLVAERGLGLTPLIFLAAGLLFVMATMSYVEGGAMFLERGGSSTLARYAFNELVSFVAGWAILIDYVIVIAIAAISVPHYLTPLWNGFGHGAGEIVVAGGVIVAVAAVNVAGFSGRRRQRSLAWLAIADLGLQLAVICVGAAVVFDPGALTVNLDPFSSPSGEDVIYALVLATVAFAGIEAASDVAPELEFEDCDLRRVVAAGGVVLPLLYAGMAVVALMAVPVVSGPRGPETELGDRFIENPVLGVVESFEPAWLSDVMTVGVVLVAPAVLLWAASTAMLGLSRHVYTLATNRQIPSWLGKLRRRSGTPYVAIVIATVICVGLVLPGDIRFLAGVYAFGATLAIAIAHLSVVRLRATLPGVPRPFSVPLNVTMRGVRVPLPALAGDLMTAAAWISVVIFHEGARYVGGAWMAFGIGAYVFYRVVVERTSVTERVSVPERALYKDVPEVEYREIVVPVFGSPLDDDVVGTAGRLADAADEPGEAPPRVHLVYVMELPLTVPLRSPPPKERSQLANEALRRAAEIAGEYETVEVATAVIRARAIGAGIVQAARELPAEVIVMGVEPPTRVRGGAILGGIGGHRPAEIGPITEYVLRRAPCPVLLTAAVGEAAAGDP